MRKHLLILFISLFTTCIAFAQVTTSSMSGVVVDEKGQTVPGATVTAVHNPTGTNYVTVTRADGRFNLANIRIGGPYSVKIKFIGYKDFTQDISSLALGQDYKLNVKITPSSTQLTEVNISGVEDKLINNGRTGQQTTIDRAQIDALPTISRSIFDFTKLEPTANVTSFGGRNNQFNSVTVDGALFNNSFGLSSQLGGQTNSQPISLDAVEQVQVNISPFDVTQGRFAGTGINLVTKSGTNDIKGSAYYYFRNSNLVGVKAGNVTLAAPPVNYHQQGFTIGGPIIKNKLFLFFSGEQERVSDPATTYTAALPGQTPSSSGTISQVPADTLNKLRNFLQSKYGFAAGNYDSYNLRTQSDKISTKLDWNINDKNTLSVKYFYLKSLRDAVPSGRGPSYTNLPFQSAYYTINNNFNIGIAELNTRFSSKLANKLTVGYQALRDFRTSQSDGTLPYVEIANGSNVPTTEFGYEQFTAGNLLNTDTYQFSDNLTLYQGRHEISVGTTNEYNKYKNGFAPQYNGAYFFNNLADFINSANNGTALANRFLQSYSAEPGGAFPYADLKAASYGVYAQDKWQVTDRLRVTYGIRADIPTYSVGTKDQNPYVQNLTLFRDGIQPDVSQYPKTRVQLSPRFGFDWDVFGDATTQLRGGAGIFTGPPPFVYVSNQASNNGVQFGSVSINNTAAVQSDPTLRKYLVFQPNINANRPVNATANTSYNLALVSPDFKYPKNLRTDIAVDQKLPFGVTGTLEFLFTKDINGAYQENLVLPSTGTPLVGSDNRIRYNFTGPTLITLPNGTQVTGPQGGNTVYPNLTAAQGGNTAANPAISSAIYLLNTNKGYTYNVTAQLQKYAKNYTLTASYTHGDSRNVNDGGSTALGQYTGRPVSGDPNADVTSYSGFYVPDRFFATASYHFEYAKNFATSVGLTLEVVTPGTTSYVYGSGTSGATDFNGDGVSGNDLMYIPKDATKDAAGNTVYDVVLVPDNAQDLRTTAQLNAQLTNYINQDPYLYKHKGEYAQRNALVIPSSQIYNFNFTQKLFVQSGKRRNTLQFEFNIINVGNFLNRNWGNVKFVNTTRPLNFKGLIATGPDAGKPSFSFPYLDNTNQIPLTSTFGNGTGQSSRSQAQIGLRYIFD